MHVAFSLCVKVALFCMNAMLLTEHFISFHESVRAAQSISAFVRFVVLLVFLGSCLGSVLSIEEDDCC